MRRDKIPGNWKGKVVETLPYRDEATGEIVPDDPPLNTDGFWTKPKVSTADYVKKNKHTQKDHPR